MASPKHSEALRQIVEQHAALVGRIASSYEARADLVDELVQDVFLAVWRALDGFRAEASMKTFVARIAHNVCASHVRRAVRSRTTPLEEQHLDAAPSAEHDTYTIDVRARLLAAIRALPLPDRQIATLHLEGFSNAEIGESLDIGEGNVAVRLTRLRAKLKQRMGEDR